MSDDKHAGGRPPRYTTPEEMQVAIDSYFLDCPDIITKYTKDGAPFEIRCPTRSGLALHLGFCDRQSMFDYQKKPEFSCTIKKAMFRMEREYEMDLRFGRNTSGSIFALKNHGWSDKQEVEHSGEVTGAPIIMFGDTSKRKKEEDTEPTT